MKTTYPKKWRRPSPENEDDLIQKMKTLIIDIIDMTHPVIKYCTTDGLVIVKLLYCNIGPSDVQFWYPKCIMLVRIQIDKEGCCLISTSVEKNHAYEILKIMNLLFKWMLLRI